MNGDERADVFEYFETSSQTSAGTQSFYTIADQAAPIGEDNLWRWRSTDVNGDGRTDWVFVDYANVGMIITSLITQSDGTRQRVSVNVSTAGASSPEVDHVDAVAAFFVGDVGGGSDSGPDGLADLIVVDDSRQMIVTLLGNGNGTWRPVVTSYDVPNHAISRGHLLAGRGDVRNWRAMDVNGDGLTDFVHTALVQVLAGAAGELRVDTLLATVMARGAMSSASIILLTCMTTRNYGTST